MRSFSSLFVILAIACRVEMPDVSDDLVVGHDPTYGTAEVVIPGDVDDDTGLEDTASVEDTGEVECETLTWYLDYDQDGYGDDGTYGWPTVEACDQPDGYVADNTDCDDWHDAQNPGVIEYCNDADDDCDGIIPEDEIDSDEDGFNECGASVDCDDTDPNVYPGNGC